MCPTRPKTHLIGTFNQMMPKSYGKGQSRNNVAKIWFLSLHSITLDLVSSIVNQTFSWVVNWSFARRSIMWQRPSVQYVRMRWGKKNIYLFLAFLNWFSLRPKTCGTRSSWPPEPWVQEKVGTDEKLIKELFQAFLHWTKLKNVEVLYALSQKEKLFTLL